MAITFSKVQGTSGDKGKSATQWTVGETYTGYLTGSSITNSRFGEMKKYTLTDADDDGKPTTNTTTLVSSTGLEPLLNKVKDNQLVQIKCLGKVGTSKAVRFEVATAEQYL